MFGSGILNVAIGLILVFLLFSLIMAAVSETVDALLKLRAKNLQKALGELLRSRRGGAASESDPLAEFYNHPLIFALYRGGVRQTPGKAGFKVNGPSYIPARTFAQAVMSLSETARALPDDSPARQAYELFAGPAKDRLERAQAELEAWYDGAMDRASGWYRRRTQWILLLLGCVLAILLNINAFTLARQFSVDQELTRRMVEIAAGLAPQQQGATEAQAGQAPEPASVETAWHRVNDLTKSVREAGLPIGWDEDSVNALKERLALDTVPRISGLLELLFGYLIVGFAATLGAPFWFDVLNKFMVIRSTVKPREKSREEGSEDRQS